MYKILLIVFQLFITAILATPASQAETRNKVFGEVNIQDTDEKKEDSYIIQENDALNYAKNIASELAKKQTAPISFSISSGGIFYLSGLYLYCSSKSGACPFILDTILVGEYLSKRDSQKPTCQNMKAFWDSWIKNGFEERLPYLVPVGATSTMKTFNSQKRNSYIKCEETLSNFVLEQKLEKNVALTVKLIEQIKSKGINVFVQTGALAKKTSE